MRFLPEFHRLLEQELSSVNNERLELTKFWARLITKINSRTVARAEIPDDVIERMAGIPNVAWFVPGRWQSALH